MSRTAYAIIFASCYLALLVIGYCRGPHPAEARNYCGVEPYMRTSIDCSRVPTVAKPYCKPPGY